jgi:outer membrane autotransporter protein
VGPGDVVSNDPSENIITVRENIDGIIYGGQDRPTNGDGFSEKNKVTVQGPGDGGTPYITVTDAIYGGYADPWSDQAISQATRNEVTVSYVQNLVAPSSSFSVVGGRARLYDTGFAKAEDNIISVTEMTARGTIVGGVAYRISDYAPESGPSSASHNTVGITESRLYGSVYGGEAASGVDAGGASDANDNHVTITSSDIYGSVVDIVALDPSAGNVIGTVVYGGFVDTPVQDGDRLNSIGNSVAIENTEMSAVDIAGGYVAARSFEGTVVVSGNTVTLKDGASVTGNAYGGLYWQDETSGYVSGSDTGVVIDNKVILEGATIGQYSGDQYFVETTGGVYGGHVYHDPDNQAQGNFVVFKGDDPQMTLNSVSFVDAGGSLIIEGGGNTITGSPDKMSRAWDVEISGGVTDFVGALWVYEKMSVAEGTVAFGYVTIGRSGSNAVAPELAVTGGSMTVTGGLTIAGEQSLPGAVKVSGGELIFDDALFATGGTYPTGIVAGNVGLIKFVNESVAQLDYLTVNAGGKVEFNDSSASFSQSGAIHVNGGELALIGGSTGGMTGLNEVTVVEGPGGRPALSLDAGYTLSTVAVDIGDDAWVSVSGGAGVLSTNETRVGDGATIDIGDGATFAGGTTVSVGDSVINIHGDGAEMSASSIALGAGSRVNIGGEDSGLEVLSALTLDAGAEVSVLGEGARLNVIGAASVSGQIIVDDGAYKNATVALAVTGALNINNGGSLILDGTASSRHVIGAGTMNVLSGGLLETNGDSAIGTSGLAVQDGGVFNVMAGTTEVSSGTVSVAGELNFADGASKLEATAGLSVQNGGEVNLGTGTIDATGAGVVFSGTTYLTIGFDSAGNGSISADTIQFNGTVNLDLQGDAAYKQNKTIFSGNVSVTGAINVTGVNDLLFTLADDGSGGIMLGYRGASGAVDVLADRNSFKMTPNYVNAAALIGEIESDPNYAALAQSLVDSLVAIDNADPSLTEIALKQLIGEYVLGVSEAVNDVALKTTGVVFGRLDKIRSSSSVTPPAAGSPDSLNRVWAGAFGAWARQNNRNDVFGYRYRSGGFALGYDRAVASLEGLALGASLSFSTGELKNSSGYSSVDIDTIGFGLYGSYASRSGIFVDLSASYGRSDNESNVYLVTGGKKSGKFHVDTWQLAARVGYLIEAGNLSVTPSVGLRYLNFRQGAWRETVTGSSDPAVSFSKRSEDLLEIPLQIKLNGVFEVGSAQVTPELRLGYTYAAKRPDNSIRIGFAGYDGQTIISGIKARRSSFQAGVGVKITTVGPLDVYANYDASFASGFFEHQGSLGIGVEF